MKKQTKVAGLVTRRIPNCKAALLTSLILGAGIATWWICQNQATTTPAHTQTAEPAINPQTESIATVASTPLPPDTATPQIQTTETEDGTTLTIFTDPSLVFQKAFWRRPSPTDNVLNAQRLEWTDNSGNVLRWQWFIELKPAPETRDWLATNPFSLPPATSFASETTPQQPNWFPTDFSTGYKVLQSPNQRHILATTTDGTHLYATDSGFGFQP